MILSHDHILSLVNRLNYQLDVRLIENGLRLTIDMLDLLQLRGNDRFRNLIKSYDGLLFDAIRGLIDL
jgi:hypothetical protein